MGDEEGEGPPSDYDAAGVLTAPLAAFSELRLLRAGTPPPGTSAEARPGSEADADAAAEPAALAEPGAGQQASALRLSSDVHAGAAASAAAAPGPAAGSEAEVPVGSAPSRGILRVPQPPARQAASTALGLSPTPDPGPDRKPSERAANAARRAMASGLAPVAVMRRMRGAGVVNPSPGVGAGAAAGAAGAERAAVAAPLRPASGQPPQRAPSAAGEPMGRERCVSPLRVLWARAEVPAAVSAHHLSTGCHEPWDHAL